MKPKYLGNASELRREISDSGFSGLSFSVLLFSFVLFSLLPSLSVLAQPSGGPYGPVRQTYLLPKVDGKIYYVAPDGKKEAAGETLAAPTTIEAAIERVKTGDAIVMRGGT
jgi:hypothetical protein